ncbi:MAG: hypothetical protein PHE83_18950, partial [Opitutaceae bacterium]|nr:hypothetical protein [Opitutaceae bacterium]
MESGNRDDAVAKVAEIIRQYLAAGGYPTPPAIAAALNKAGFSKAVIPRLKDAYAAARGGEQRPLKKRKKPRKESDIRGLASRANADEEMDWGAVEGFFSDHEGEADSETGVGQVPIQAFSAGRSHGETMPENMVGPITEALADLEAREGKTVDEYVSEKLGLTVEQMLGGEEPMFSASQVDRLALAISANENGRSFIDASGTGMGKGRVAAALIRYAKRRGLLPIFVTWDPPLYKDMLERDLPAVGMPESELGLVVPTNNALNLMRDDGTPYRVPNPSGMLEAIADSIAAGNPEHFVTVRGKKQRVGAIFTTHSQISPVQGDNPARVEALQRMAPGTMLIVDESHGSAGADSGRGQNMQGLVANSGTTDFASATFAKRPEMLALYSLRSTIRHAVQHAQQIEDMAKKGGRALMEVLASMMGRDGGLYRAEMNMAGVKISVGEPDITAPIAPETVNAFADILAAMRGFDESVMGALPEIANHLARDQQFLLADKIDLDKTSFISLFHNVVQQALVAVKVDLAADRMIKHINEGRKVFLMLYNTMEAATENIIETLGIQIGDEFGFSVGDLYQRALRRCRTISVKPIDRDGNPLPAVHLYLDDNILAAAAPRLLEMFNRVSDRLSTNPELAALPGSPIDWLEHRLRLAGIDFYEATGRKSRFVYNGDGMKGAIFPREGSETGVQARVAAISRYNGKAGQPPLHAIIANPSASTGISAHASPGTGTDYGRQRVGLILQPVHDVAIFLQMLRRINRMGQTLQPAYEF